MLNRLYIRNYGLFEETEINFPSGLNILTGETGAGKSLLIGAIGLLMGKRADSTSIFLSAEKCIVEGEFYQLSKEISKQLNTLNAFEIWEGEVFLRREIYQSGKSRAFVNDSPVSLNILKEVSGLLLDLHGQHENQGLMNADRQIDLLDTFGDLQSNVLSFGHTLKEAHQLRQSLDDLQKRERDMREKLDYLKHQLSELEEADLKEDEESALEQELNLLQHSETIRSSLGSSLDQLYETDSSLFAQLGETIHALDKISGIYPSIEKEVEQLNEAQNHIKEVAFNLKDQLDMADSDPERMQWVEDRLATYYELKRKYGAKDGGELIAKFTSLKEQLENYESIGTESNELEQALDEVQKELSQEGLKIEAGRLNAKEKLEHKVNQLLAEVGFQKARFSINVQRGPEKEGGVIIDGQSIQANAKGINKIQFLIQSNPGVPAGQLSQVASGGEISRVMLAIKAALAEKSEFPVLIFDEIDTGISGEIANKVGNVMLELANRFQILAITHLPQIAAKGDQHFKISKHIKNDQTTSSIQKLDKDQRVQELASLLSGDQPSDFAIQNASELLRKAKN